MTLWAPHWILRRGRGGRSNTAGFSSSAWLVTIVGILLLMSSFFFLEIMNNRILSWKHRGAHLSQPFPLALYIRRLFSPLFTNNFGDLGICKSRVLLDNLGLVMLTIQDESYKEPYTSVLGFFKFSHRAISKTKSLG